MISKVWNTFSFSEQRSLIILLVFLLFSSLLELFGLVLVIPYVSLMMDVSLMDKYLQEYPYLKTFISIEGNYRVDLSLFFAGFYVVKNILLVVFTFVQRTILKSIHANISDRMFNFYMYQPYRFHLKNSSSGLIRSVTYDVSHFMDGVLVQGAVLVSEILLLGGVLLVLVWENPVALIVFVVMAFPIVVVYLIIKWRLNTWGIVLQQREAKVISHLQEGLGGIKDVIIRHAQPYFEEVFYKNVWLRAHVKRNRDVAMMVPRYIIETMMMISMAGALIWLDAAGGIVENLPAIAFMAVVIVRLMPMSNRVFAAISTIKASGPSAEVVYRGAKPRAIDRMSDKFFSKSRDEVISFCRLDVKQLSFSYDNAAPVVNEVGFSVRKGEVIGIVGGSGSGKTTLVDLLLGLLVPTRGSVVVNNKDIQETLVSWQKNIGYVPQNVFLLDATIKENIAFGVDPGIIDERRLDEVIRLAKLDGWLSTLPENKMAVVGERGVRISGGQRQRIGIARALYHNPDLLVLDEATSALDNRTEKDIMDDVYLMHGERTIIMIAHRLDTIRRCDRILVLKNGELVGEGTYNNLLRDNVAFQEISQVYDGRV